MNQFSIGKQEYIQLNDLLKHLSIVGTGGEAKIIILNGEVKVNGEVELQVRKKLRPQDVVEVYNEKIKIV